jgi:paraquat-inducible protein A
MPLYHADTELGAILAVAITATVAFVVANRAPLITMVASGHQTQATLWSAIRASYNSSLPVVATGLGMTLIVAPIVELFMLLYVLVPLLFDQRPPGFRWIMRGMNAMRPWRLVEVFLLGVVIAIVKLGALAEVTLGWGAFGLTVMAMAMATLGSFDLGVLWDRADHAAGVRQ